MRDVNTLQTSVESKLPREMKWGACDRSRDLLGAPPHQDLAPRSGKN
jgi:hypothetical protein